MTDSVARWARVQDIFHTALERTSSDRDAFLREACSDDGSLRAEVDSLLLADKEAGAFAERPAIDGLGLSEVTGSPDRQLQPGDRLGPYTIERWLGAGGMGEVYRARDGTLGRDVALKILPRLFDIDPERRARFDREARLLAALNHPHIGAIYGVVDSDGIRALVLELVDGDTLADRLAQGPIPIDAALPIARQIADALEAAHEKGIVHRDLKPANIKITPDGSVKVLDFGLAKAVSGEAPGPDLTQSPARTDVGTREGVLLGTVAYMSPEQARGKPVDKRTDIWAFGCVLYELLSGRQAFTGATGSDVMAHVLEREPDWSALSAATPPAVHRLLERCLHKDPKNRLRDVGDARFELTRGPEIEAAPSQKSRQRRRTREWADFLVAVTAVALAVVMGIAWYRSRAAIRSLPAVRFAVPPPAGSRFERHAERTYLSLSPDGSQLAFIARSGSNASQVWLRPLSALDARPIAGTDGALSVFWAPDSRSFAFFAGGKLKRADVSGSAVVPICDAPEVVGLFGTWGEAGQILFASVEGAAIFRVSTTGGTPVPEIERNLSRGEARIHWPWFLPDGRRFLYVARLKDGSGQIMLKEPGHEPRPLVSAVYNPQWLDPDILLFVRDGTIMGQRIDLAQARAIGEPFSIAGPIDHQFSTGRAMFTASNTGGLAYQSHTDLDRFLWVDRAGHALGAVGVDGGYQSVRLSSDGQTLLFDRIHPPTGTQDVWTLRLDRNLETRLTSDPGTESFPVWMPEGRGVVFMADRGGPPHLFTKNISTEADDPLLPPGRLQRPQDVSAAGDILFIERTERGNYDVRMLHAGDLSVSDLFNSPFDEQQPRLSPDNRAIAVVSDETGRYELYVTSFPPKGPKVPVSIGGASIARWAPDGRELFYLAADGRVMTVPVRTQPVLEIGAPMPLFTPNPAAPWKDFDVARDGRRFLAIVPQSRATEQPLTVVINWTAGLASR